MDDPDGASFGGLNKVASKLLAILSCAIFLLGKSEVKAQNAEARRFHDFVKSNFYSGLVRRSLAAIPKPVFEMCPTLVPRGSKVTVIKPVSFGADGFPNAGAWKQSFPVSGCGNDTVLNFFFTVGAEEKINTIIGAPGTTHADPILQRDTLFHARLIASSEAKDCETFVVKNTKFEAYGARSPAIPDPGPGTPKRPWSEMWTMVGCGHTLNVSIAFVPDATGTQIIAHRATSSP